MPTKGCARFRADARARWEGEGRPCTDEAGAWRGRLDQGSWHAVNIFQPAPFWRSPHVQTMCAALPFWAPPRGFSVPSRERLRVRVAGGGAVIAEAWWALVGPSEPRPAVVLVHGVGGSCESRYMVRAAVAFHRAGFHVVRMNMRGAGEGVACATSLYHAGLTSDVEDVAHALAADTERVSSVALVGFS